jgi:hypothetical protein
MSLSAVKSSKHFGMEKVRNIMGAQYGYKGAGDSDRKYKLNNNFGRYKMIKCYTYDSGKFMENTKLQNDSIIELVSPTQGEIESVAKFLQGYKISEYDIKALIDGDFDKIKAVAPHYPLRAARFNDSLNAMILTNAHILVCHDNKNGAPKELMQMFQGLWTSVNVAGHINLDLADVISVLAGRTDVCVDAGSGKGEAKRDAIANMLSHSPDLQDALKHTSGVIVNMTASPDINLDDVDANVASLRAAMHPDADTIFSIDLDGELDDEIIATVTATK